LIRDPGMRRDKRGEMGLTGREAKEWGHWARGFVPSCLLLLMISLAACDGAAYPIDTAMVAGNEEIASDRQITLRYSSFLLDTAQAGKVYYDAIREFEEQNPNIRIETDFIQNNNYMAGMKIRLLGGEKVDVFDVWSPSLFNEFRMLRRDLYLDLTGSAFLNDFIPDSLKPVTIDGKVYGVPEVMHSDGLLYNKTLFEQWGLRVPQTWNEFLALCETLKDHGLIPVAMDGEWASAQFFWGSIMSDNGADEQWTRDLESGKIKITDPLFVDAIRKHREIIDRGYVPPNWMNLRHEQAKDLVGQGKAAMIIAGTWDIPSIMARNPAYEIDFMLVPGEEKTVPNINVGTYRVIHARTEHPEEAKQFVAFMNGKENQERLAEGVLGVPSIASARVQNPTVTKIASIIMREDAVLYWPHTVSTESLQVKIQEGVNRFLAGESLEAALGEIQEAIDHAQERLK